MDPGALARIDVDFLVVIRQRLVVTGVRNVAVVVNGLPPSGARSATLGISYHRPFVREAYRP